MNNLTKIASLPGSGAGYMSALAPEVATPKANQDKDLAEKTVTEVAALSWPPIVFLDEEPECS